MWFHLVPERGRCNVILQRKVAASSFQSRSPPKGLDGCPDVLAKSNWIHDVPPVHPESLLAAIESVRFNHLCQAGIRGTEDAVLAGWMFEIPSATKIVLRAGTANGRPLAVAIQVKLDLASPHHPLLFTPHAR